MTNCIDGSVNLMASELCQQGLGLGGNIVPFTLNQV